MFDLNKALAAWRRPFRYHRGFEKTDVDELERHLRDQVYFLVEQGMEEEAAFHQAVREMGGVVEAESEYQKVYFLRLKHNQTRLRELFFYGAMLKNYILIAYRNLLKNKTASFINLFGLSVAIGCCMVAYMFVYSNAMRNAFHEHASEIFLVEHTLQAEGELQTWGNSPRPLGPRLAADVPQVVRTVRLADARGIVERDGNVFNQWLRFADPGFFEMFSFPLKYGSPDVLRDPDAVILSPSTAERYFGEANPIGEQLTFLIDDTYEETFTVRGVTEPLPNSSGIQFRVLINYDVLQRLGRDLDDWEQFTTATFIQVNDADDVEAIAGQMGEYRALQRAVNEEHPIEGFVFENLVTMPWTNRNVHNSVGGMVPMAPVIVLSCIALFLLTLSCVNYMNISLAAATRRLREIGVRKVVGSNKAQLVVQFLTENIVLCVLALVAGTVLAHFFLLPSFNEISGSEFSIPFTESVDLWLFLLILLLIIGVISGAYPAFYVAAMPPVVILRGEPASRGKKRFMQAFLTVQFVLAFITMIACTMLVLNGRYQANQDWGYDKEHTLVIRLPESNLYPAFRSAALQIPHIEYMAGTQHHVGKSRGWVDVHIQGEPMEAEHFDVSPTYDETMGLRLKTGRFLEEGDAGQVMVVNEAFVNRHGWSDEEALQQSVRLDSINYAIAGIVYDFHYNDFFDRISPIFFRLGDEDAFEYLAMRTKPGTAVLTAEAMAGAWARLQPDIEFDNFFFFQDTAFDEFYEESQGVTNVFIFTALMALLISCMGLFGLAAQNVASRMKEISIRKVLGASVLNVTQLVNRRFFALLVIAAVVASPISFFLVNALLGSIYTYHLPVGPAPFVIAYALVFITAALTISTQLRRVITANPAQELRNE